MSNLRAGRRAQGPRALRLGVILLGVACFDADGMPSRQAAAGPRAPNRGAVAAGRVVRPPDPDLLDSAYAQAAALPRMRSLLVAIDGRLVRERYFGGASADRAANVKSASKSVISTLVGVALQEGRLRSLGQPIGELLPAGAFAPPADPAARDITVEDLLTMRAGLRSTSSEFYGAWVESPNWVRHALTRPVVAPAGHDGGPMIYSTGNTHVLSAILTRVTGQSTLAYARRVLGEPLGVTIPAWQRDPQGVFVGGNNMYLTPRAMLAFGNLYLNRGRTSSGRPIVPAAWVDSSWVARTRSPRAQTDYGYGWWARAAGGTPVNYAWGFGGQYIFVVPAARLVVVVTSDDGAGSREGGYRDAVFELLDRFLVPAARDTAR